MRDLGINVFTGRKLIVNFNDKVSVLYEEFDNVKKLSEDSQNDQFEYKAGIPDFVERFLNTLEDCCGGFLNIFC